MTARWNFQVEPDAQADELITSRLVEYNKQQAQIVRERFEPENLSPRPLAVYAYVDDRLVGGVKASTVDLWKWLTIDILWVDEAERGHGLGEALLAAAEREGCRRGCRWSKVNTWDFQAPGFYERCGYVEYGREVDYPPGHTNFLLRKDLLAQTDNATAASR
ncbi:MAG TPA: GNAT family N-acetyltransferase [Nocardioidaceae bacterium]|nr:GNAT family N-acetyltransferase [Nocardioidaceae bacterium]